MVDGAGVRSTGAKRQSDLPPSASSQRIAPTPTLPILRPPHQLRQSLLCSLPIALLWRRGMVDCCRPLLSFTQRLR